jgi:hypothetical protein
VPVYGLGARMLEIHPGAPVVHTLAVALLRYDQGLHGGFDADWDRFPDLHERVEATEHEWQHLHQAALASAPELARGGKKRRRSRRDAGRGQGPVAPGSLTRLRRRAARPRRRAARRGPGRSRR